MSEGGREIRREGEAERVSEQGREGGREGGRQAGREGSAASTCPSARPPIRARRRTAVVSPTSSTRAWYGMLVSMVRSNLTIHAIMLRQSPVHRPLLLMKPESLPTRSLRKSLSEAMISA